MPPFAGRFYIVAGFWDAAVGQSANGMHASPSRVFTRLEPRKPRINVSLDEHGLIIQGGVLSWPALGDGVPCSITSLGGPAGHSPGKAVSRRSHSDG